MTIKLSNAGKRFNRDWIFRNATYTFLAGHTYAITGPNGSGKSTLLQAIAGSSGISEGKIEWQINGLALSGDTIYNYLTIAAPYVEVIEEMTATEFLLFHQQFKPLIETLSIREILTLIGLDKAANKQIRYYSSGMKQRIKLAQAIFSNVPLLLLDEPCTNMDQAGFNLYNKLISDYANNKTIIVSSNDLNEYSFCRDVISIMDYK
ncbi:ATP-binding cassette domain-containing protein [Segetibacter sp.]|jgi:ABC-type multidrug transport system ATPase subunit|uniref:ABC transporter ATP-binding protein n=1 Tax=Segetibacter sp. TaxID=2231182 RepID=UPI002632BA9B|nr:ATP-binding cassette domain-containing protein [Segetibacter sp.]MCW3082031.1 ATP-binding cassette protein [Segetibacter sp.]